MKENFTVSASLIEHYDDKDWIYYNDIIETPSLNFEKSGQIQYNQKEVHKNSCFLHWPMWAISDLTWYEFTLEERKHLVSEAWKTEWASPEYWGYFNEACKFIVKWWNENKASKEQWISYYRIWKQDREKALNKGYSIVIWYYTNRWFSKDKQDDWVINNSVEHEWKNNWHCVRWWRLVRVENTLMIDNYKWVVDHNIVEIEEITTEYFWSWYIFVLKEDVRDWYEWLSVEDKIKKLKNRK